MKIPELKLAGDEKNTKDNELADLETAIKLTGYGKYHIILIAIGGYCFFTSGLEYGLHAYTLPYAQCDLQISTAQMGLINAMFMAGSITCSIFCGAIADIVGRKKVIVIALFLGGVSTIISSWSTSYVMFATVRFVSGFMSGGPGCLIFSYAGEFCSDKHRSRGICVIGFCWTLAWLILPTASWLIVPSSLGFESAFFKYSTWRVFVALIGGTPGLIASALVYFWCTETPKFLCVHGREDEALDILKSMYHRNTGNPPESYPVKRLVSTFSASADTNTNKLDISQAKGVKDFVVLVFSQMRQVFRPAHYKRAILISSIYFTNFFGYYGLGLWLPELFNRFQAYYAANPDSSITVCELSHQPNLTAKSYDFDEALLSNLTNICPQRSINLAVFTNTFIIGAAASLGNVFAVVMANKIGGRLLSAMSMLLAGICTIIVYFSRSETQIVVVNCFFMAGVGTAMTAIGTCIVNLFPTSIRAVGVCVGILFGRLGAICSNLIFGLLLDASCEVPFFFLGGVIILGSLLCYLLPKESQKAVE